MIPSDSANENLIDNWSWRLLLRIAHCFPRRFLAACLVAAWDIETRDDVWFEDMVVGDLLNRLIRKETIAEYYEEADLKEVDHDTHA